ncbi:NAD(P)/FAD-dependent oxidoreductase [Kushneria aurantia]|uniref:NAD(P)/FAD-dependent oxidoreductase n=1 Tax=Kushneria aurantia TaxID=504092 RepID=A0ABV6FZQ7_9GAMM|nr:FAD-dependent oxidoreductase [Kushneria aurantia]
MPSRSVAVVGGGVVGSCTALALQERGFRVTLYAPAIDTGMTSWGNAGVITHASVIPLNIPGLLGQLPRYLLNLDPALRIAPLALPGVAPWLTRFLRGCEPASVARRSAALARLIAPALDAHRHWATPAGADDLFHMTGWSKLYRHLPTQARITAMTEPWTANDVHFELLQGDALEQVFGGASRHYALGMRIPQTAYVDSPGRLVERYRDLFVQRGGEWCCDSPTAIEPLSAGYRLAGHQTVHEQLAVCAGPWSCDLLRPLGYRLPMAFERGYHQEFALDPAQSLATPFHDVDGAFVCTPMNGGVRVLTGIEFDRRDRGATPHQLRRILPRVREVLTLGEARGEPWLGRRPSFPDGLPAIGAAPRHAGLWFGFGHGHIGLSTAAVTGDWLARAMVSGQEDPARADFSPRRFGE